MGCLRFEEDSGSRSKRRRSAMHQGGEGASHHRRQYPTRRQLPEFTKYPRETPPLDGAIIGIVTLGCTSPIFGPKIDLTAGAPQAV